MPTFRVTNTRSGADLGTYAADDEAGEIEVRRVEP